MQQYLNKNKYKKWAVGVSTHEFVSETKCFLVDGRGGRVVKDSIDDGYCDTYAEAKAKCIEYARKRIDRLEVRLSRERNRLEEFMQTAKEE